MATATPSPVDLLAQSSHETAYGGVVVTSTAGRRRTVVRAHGELDTAGTARPNSAAIAFLRRLQAGLDPGRVRVVLRPSEAVRRLLDLAGPPSSGELSPTG